MSRVQFEAMVLMFFLMALVMGPGICEAGRDPLYKVDVLVQQGEGKLVEGTVRSHTLVVDQPVHFGGGDSAPTPPETYAFSVGACLVSALRFVAELEKLPVGNIQARVVGTLDIEKAMGVDMEKRAGFPELEIHVSFDAPWSAEEKQAFVDRVMERCPICDNTRNSTPVTIVVSE